MPHAIIRERMVADTKSISAMHRSASKSTPATRPSRFLLRQILKPMRRNADGSRLLNIPRNLFSEASGAAARRSSTSSLKKRASVMGVWGRRLSIYRTKQAKTPRPRRRTPTLNRLGQICMSGTAEPCCPEEETPVGGNAGVSEADDHRFWGICDRPAEANAYARPPVPALCSESE